MFDKRREEIAFLDFLRKKAKKKRKTEKISLRYANGPAKQAC
jgi:hypothetical protein